MSEWKYNRETVVDDLGGKILKEVFRREAETAELKKGKHWNIIYSSDDLSFKATLLSFEHTAAGNESSIELGPTCDVYVHDLDAIVLAHPTISPRIKEIIRSVIPMISISILAPKAPTRIVFHQNALAA